MPNDSANSINLDRPAAHNETRRSAPGLRLFDEMGGDIRYGLRALRCNPGFAVQSLAPGIGATKAIFSLIYAELLHPFPCPGTDRIVKPILVDQQYPDAYSWFPLGKAQMECNAPCSPGRIHLRCLPQRTRRDVLWCARAHRPDHRAF